MRYNKLSFTQGTSQATAQSWQVYLPTQHSTAASGTWDHLGLLVSSSLAASGNFTMCRLQASGAYPNLNSGSVWAADIRNMLGTTVSSIDTSYMIHLCVDLPTGSTLPPGCWAAVGLTNGLPQTATTAMYAGIRNDSGVANAGKAFVGRAGSGAHTLNIASNDAVGIKAVISHATPASVTQQSAHTAISLNGAAEVMGATTQNVAHDDIAAANWQATHVVYGFGWTQTGLGTALPASVTASFKILVNKLTSITGGSLS